MLAALGVTYVVVHTDVYAPDEWTAVEHALIQHSSRLVLQHGDSSGRVYQLK